MLTQEEWDALSQEEQATRQEEKPEPAANPGDQTVAELTASVKDLKTQLDSLQTEKQGIYRDLKTERDTRQQLEGTIKELQDRGQGNEFDIEQMADDDYLTAGQVKKLMKGLQTKSASDTAADLKQKANENYAADEETMKEKTATLNEEFPIPYEDAIAEFTEMAKSRPGLWRSVHEESLRSKGKPAETAYRIALTSKKFMDKIAASVREKLLQELEDKGEIKPKKLPSGGPGKAEINPANLTEEDLMNLSDAQLDELLKKTN